MTAADLHRVLMHSTRGARAVQASGVIEQVGDAPLYIPHFRGSRE